MQSHRNLFAWAGALTALASSSVLAGGSDVRRIHGPEAQTLLGDGTGVVVGIVDSGVDSNHSALAGTVSSGLPRLVAQANFVTTEPGNTGQDVFGHGTAVAGQVMSRDSRFPAIATDARYVNARVLDSNNEFNSTAWVINGAGFALDNGANLLNMSLGFFSDNTSGQTDLSRMSDYITFGRRIPVTISAGNAGTASLNHKPQGPGDAFNVFSTGSTSRASNFSQIVSDSSYGPTTDGRIQPSIVAPGDIVAAPDISNGTFSSWHGTSFAAPNVAGMLAAQMEYGQTHGLSTDPLVLRATLLNSAEKVADRNGNPWAPNASSTSAGVFTATSPLNASAGAGQIDGIALFNQYSPGEMNAGDIAPTGWDMSTITGTSTSADYHLGQLVAGTSLTATLDWFRHVGWTDNGDSVLNASDSFPVLENVDNLNLSVFRDGALFARSISTVDTVEHLWLTNLPAGDYVVRVTRVSGGGADEQYGLAWMATVPEPGLGIIAAACATAAKLVFRSRARRSRRL